MIKNNLIVVSFVLLFLSNSIYADQNSDPKPIAVVIERDQWQACTGTPTMVLYEDGTFIFSDMLLHERCKYKYKKRKLETNEFKDLLRKLGPTKEFMSLNEDYMLSYYFDLPSVDIYLSNNQHTKAVSIYGVEKHKNQLKIDSDGSEGTIPEEFNRVFEVLQSIPREGATKWKPEYVRIDLKLMEDQSLKTISWPTHWPDLNNKQAIRWSNTSYLIYLPASKKVKKYFKKLDKKESYILLDDKKWDFIFSRVTFPYEYVWWKAFK